MNCLTIGYRIPFEVYRLEFRVSGLGFMLQHRIASKPHATQLRLESLRRYRLPSSVIPGGVDEATETTLPFPRSVVTHGAPEI